MDLKELLKIYQPVHSRIDELSIIYSYMNECDVKKAKEIILSTPTGQAVKEEHDLLLAESPESNLVDVLEELKQKYDVEDILKASRRYNNSIR